MRFLSNTYNPKNDDVRFFVPRGFYETQEEAWNHYVFWLKDKFIGEPEASEKYSVAELKEMGYVGVYSLD